MTWRALAHGAATKFIHPFIHHSSESDRICLHISVFCVHHVMCVYISIPPLPTGTLQRVNPSLPACFATDRQLFITTSWLASELCPTVSNCYTGKPKYSRLTPTHKTRAHTHTHWYIWADGGTVEERRGKNIFLFVPLLDMCCSGSGSPSEIVRWEADKALSDRRSPLWTPRPWEETRLVLVLLYLSYLLQVSR